MAAVAYFENPLKYLSRRIRLTVGIILLLTNFLAMPAYAYQLMSAKWPQPSTSFHVNIPGANGLWNTAFETAMYYWGQGTNFHFTSVPGVYSDPCASTDDRNGVAFGATICGEAWGSERIAVCQSYGTGTKVEADIIFNSNYSWNVYSTPWSPATLDFQRVAVHELGHALGLDHEDNGARAIMQSRASDITQPQQDDIDGVAALYGVPAPSAIRVPLKDADGNYTVSWDGSSVTDAWHILQEATDSGFTAGVRDIPRGTETSASITGRTFGVTYYYRVKTYKSGQSESGWLTADNGCTIAPATVPGPPTGVWATAGVANASIAFTAPLDNGGIDLTGYTVTSSPGAITATGAASPITVIGLTVGTPYTFTVTANNAKGSSLPSAPSNSVIPFTVPQPPMNVRAVPGDGTVKIYFGLPIDNGGRTITSYTATTTQHQTVTGTSSPLTMPNLENGTTYEFTVTAVNAAGSSAPSNSASAMPQKKPAISNARVVPGDGQVTIDFVLSCPAGGCHYAVSAMPGDISLNSDNQPIVVTGLTNGTTYAFTVTAIDKNNSTSIAVSTASATPSNQASMESIENSSLYELASDARVNALAADSGNNLYAGTSDGVYKHNAAENKWVQLGVGLAGREIKFLVVDNGDNLYAGTNDGVHKLASGGSRWMQLGTPLEGLRYLAVRNNQIVALTYGGLFSFAEDLNGWTPLVAPIPGNGNIILTAPIMGENGNIYAGTTGHTAMADSGVYMLGSTGGWVRISPQLPVAQDISSLFMSKSGMFYASFGGHIWTYNSTGWAIVDFWPLYSDFSGNLYRQGGNGILIGNGVSWTNFGSGLPVNSQVSFLFQDRFFDFLAVTSAGIYKLSAGYWKALGTTTTRVSFRAYSMLMGNYNNLYAGTLGDVYQQTGSSGMSKWTRIGNGLPASSKVSALALDSYIDPTLYAGTSSGVYKLGYRELDWVAIGTGLPTGSAVYSLVMDGGNNLYAGTYGGVYKRANSGGSWSLHGTGLPTGSAVKSLVLDSGGNLYAGTDGGVYKLASSGGSWSLHGAGLPTGYMVDSLVMDSGNNLYAGTYGGVFKLASSGGSWSLHGAGLPSGYTVKSLVRDSSDNLYAGAYGGIYKLASGLSDWSKRLDTALGTDGWADSLFVDTRSNNLYVGTQYRIYIIKEQNQLGITSTGNAAGTVISSPVVDSGPISLSSGLGIVHYPPGTLVTLTPAGGVGSHFTNWSGCTSTVGNDCIVDMSRDRNVTVSFDADRYTVTPVTPPIGYDGIIVPSAPQSVDYGGESTFWVVPVRGFMISGVNGCGVSSTAKFYPTQSVTTGKITADCNLQATFTPTVSGFVMDFSTGKPLAGATVTIATSGATAVTDANGNFFFSTPPPAGAHDVTVSKSGYAAVILRSIAVGPATGGAVAAGLIPTSSSGLYLKTPSTLAPASKNAMYSQAITIDGGTAPYSFSITVGTLPSGLSFDPASAIINGVPTTNGTWTFTLKVTDSLGAWATRSYKIEVTEPLAFAGTTVPRGMATRSYRASVSADTSTGKIPYQYSLYSGVLPEGLTFDPSQGEIFGTITGVAGSYGFAVKVTDAAGRKALRTFTLEVDPLLAQTTSRLNDGVRDAAYTQTMAAAGGKAPYTWKIYSGTLPAGLELNSGTGVISGTPTVAVSAPLSIVVTDADHRDSYSQHTLNIADPLVIETTSLPAGLIEVHYSEMIRVRGGMPDHSFAVAGSALATVGLSMDGATGIISGIPSAFAADSSFGINLTVTDSGWPVPQQKTVNIQIAIRSGLTITTSSVLPNLRKAGAITPVPLSAFGGSAPYRWAVVSGYLPSGLNLDPATGIISGIPSDAGEFSFTAKVTDSSGTVPATAEKTFYLHVSNDLKIVTGAVPSGAIGVPYAKTLLATGGLRNYTWLVKNGTLPAGLNLDAATGVIRGTPDSALNSSVTVEVADSDSPAQTAQRELRFEVNNTLSIYETELPIGRVGAPYLTNVRSQLGTPGFTWAVVGSLPSGLVLSEAAGVATISGTPTAPGTYTFTLKVTDSGPTPLTATRSFTLNVYGPLEITTASLPRAVRGVAYSAAVARTGGAEPYTWEVACLPGETSCGKLPQGLRLNSLTGAISGTPDPDLGLSASFKIRVIDSGVPQATREAMFAIQVTDPVTITPGTPPDALQFLPYSHTFAGGGGTAPLAWSIVETLPGGVTLNGTTGILSGTPTVCGSYPVTLVLADSGTPPSTTQSPLVIKVNCASGIFLSVTTSGTGSGSVNSDPSGIACASGSTDHCVAGFSSGTSVSLIQQASVNSTFTGWLQACTGNSSCRVAMDSTKYVTAVFAADPPTVLVEGDATRYYSIDSILSSTATAGRTVRARDAVFVENVVMSSPASVTFKGGYVDAGFSARGALSTTVIDGTLKVRSGIFRVERLRVR